MTFLDRIDPEWLDALGAVTSKIEEIEASLAGEDFQPNASHVLRALEYPLSKVRVVIFGQDPYPNPGHATGLAFSVPKSVRPIPRTLTNIYRELHDDIGCAIPNSGDLTPWAEQGIALINRILTTTPGRSAGHLNLNWQGVTNEIARVLGEREIIAILWGNYARQLSQHFVNELVIASVHPSPLSAHRGFFGSKPFSRTNQLLEGQSKRAIDWSLYQ